MRYGKINEAIWSDDKFQTLTDRSKLLYIYLLSCEQCNGIGIFRIGYGTMEDEFGRDRDEIEDSVNELMDSGLIGYKNKWLWFNKFLKWNQPINPNHAKQCAAYINDCTMKGAPVEAVWGFLSNAYGILSQLRFQTRDGQQKTYYDEFKQALDKTVLIDFLGGEDNVSRCLSGKPYKVEETTREGSDAINRAQGNVTETLPKRSRNTAQRLGTNNNNNKDNNNYKTRQNNDNQSIVLACNNRPEKDAILLMCSDDTLHDVPNHIIQRAKRKYPGIDVYAAAHRIFEKTEQDSLIRPEPKDLENFFLKAISIEAKQAGGAE